MSKIFKQACDVFFYDRNNLKNTPEAGISFYSHGLI